MRRESALARSLRQAVMHDEPETKDPFDTARELLERTASVLSSCALRGGDALETADIQELIDALRAIHSPALPGL